MSEEIEDIRLCIEDAQRGGFLETLSDVRADRETLMREVDRLRARVAELEKTLAEANEEADVREGDTLVGQIKMYNQHRYDLAMQSLGLRQRVAELEAAQEWRPIESAPRDTKVVVMLALKNGHVATARRWSANIDRWTSLDGECDYTSATHWLPLPAPPKVAT